MAARLDMLTSGHLWASAGHRADAIRSAFRGFLSVSTRLRPSASLKSSTTDDRRFRGNPGKEKAGTNCRRVETGNGSGAAEDPPTRREKTVGDLY